MTRLPDFHALRPNLATLPDEMVHDTASEIYNRCVLDAGLSSSDVLWIIEAYERQRPRVYGRIVTDRATPTESIG
jgi:hypothetical protein